MPTGLQRIAAAAALALASGAAGAHPPVRTAVLAQEGADGDRERVEAALREARQLRVIGPVDRPAPRASRDVRALGASLDVELLVVLGSRDGARVLRVFEVRRGAYFEGTLAPPFEASAVREFVLSRARTARRTAPAGRQRAEPTWRTWAAVGVVVVAAGAFAAAIALQGSEDADDTVHVDVVR